MDTPHSPAADPALRPHLGSPPRRAPPVIPSTDRSALQRQRRLAFGLFALATLAFALSWSTRRDQQAAEAEAAMPFLALPIAPDTPEPAPPWSDERVRSAAGATARGAQDCVARHAQDLGDLPGALDLIVHLPPSGPIDLRVAGPELAGATLPPAFGACLAAAAAQEPFPRPVGDRQVRLPLPVVGRLRAAP